MPQTTIVPLIRAVPNANKSIIKNIVNKISKIIALQYNISFNIYLSLLYLYRNCGKSMLSTKFPYIYSQNS